jgi:hypothetical protein
LKKLFFSFFSWEKVISKYLRLDKGTETGHMATIHAFLSQCREDVQNEEDAVYFGPSTNNKVKLIITFVFLPLYNYRTTNARIVNANESNGKNIFFFQQIERWWRELHNRLEKFFKRQLRMLLEQGHYDSHNQNDRYNTVALSTFCGHGKNIHAVCWVWKRKH